MASTGLPESAPIHETLLPGPPLAASHAPNGAGLRSSSLRGAVGRRGTRRVLRRWPGATGGRSGITGLDESETTGTSGDGGTGTASDNDASDATAPERADAGRGGRGAGGAMTDAMSGGTGGYGAGNPGGGGLGAGLGGQTRSGDIGTGTPPPGSAAGTGTTGAIPESQHIGIMGPGASDTDVPTGGGIAAEQPPPPRGAGTEARSTGGDAASETT